MTVPVATSASDTAYLAAKAKTAILKNYINKLVGILNGTPNWRDALLAMKNFNDFINVLTPLINTTGFNASAQYIEKDTVTDFVTQYNTLISQLTNGRNGVKNNIPLDSTNTYLQIVTLNASSYDWELVPLPANIASAGITLCNNILATIG